MAINLKRALLAGTALVAVSFAATPAMAVDADGNQIWANGVSGSLMNASNGDDLNVAGFTVTITNDGVANDGEGTNTFTIGGVSDTDPTGSILITTGQNATLNVGFNNVGINGDFSVVGDDGDNAAIYATVQNGLSAASLNVTTDEANASVSTNLTVSGLLNVYGQTTVTGGGITGADAYLELGDDAYFNGGLVLHDGAGGGLAHLVLNDSGNNADMYGAINGYADSNGVILIQGDTHFHDSVGDTYTLGSIGFSHNGTTTFDGTVDSAKMIFGNSGSVVFKDDVNMNSNGIIDFNNSSAYVYFDNGGNSTIHIGGDILDTSGGGYGSVNIVNGNNVVAYGSIGSSAGQYIDNLTVGYDASTVSDVTNLEVSGNIYTRSLDMWGAATLTLNGTGAQTVSGSVHGNTYSNIVVANAAGVTFEGSIGGGGTVTIDVAADDSTATFLENVDADAIALGGDGNSGDVNTANFDGSFTVSSDIAGSNAAETNDIVVTGGSDIVFSGDLGANLSTILIGDTPAYTYTYATFQGNVASGAIELKGAGTTYNYLTFSASKSIDIDATVTGLAAGGLNNVNITGGGTVNQNAVWGGNLDDLDIDNTTLVANENMTFTHNIDINGDDGVLTVAGGTTEAVNIRLRDTDSTINLDGGNLKGDVFSSGSGYYYYGRLNVLQNAQIDGNLYSLSALTLSANLEVTGNAYASDVTDIGANTLTVDGDFTLGANQELDVALSSATTSGQVVVSGNALVDEDAKIVVTTSKAWTIADGTKFVIIDANDAGTGVSDIGTNLDVTSLNSAIVGFTFEQDPDDLGNFVLVAHTSSVTEDLTGLSQPATAAGNALQEAALTSSDPAISDLMDALDTALLASDTAEAERLLTSIAPTVDGGAAQASVSSFGQQVQHIAQNRLFNLLHGGGDQIALNGVSGISAGAAAHGIGFWVQGFGQSAKQDARDMIAGYDADSAGMSAGLDTSNVIRNGILGVSFSYGNTNANSKNSNQTGIDIGSYGVNIYASKMLGNGYFLNGQAGYAYNDIDSVRHNVGLGGTASASYKSDLYSAQIGGGKDFSAGHGLTLTPSLMASYLHLATDGYTETGTGAPLLTVGSENSDSLRLGVGMTAMWDMKNDNGAKLRPAISVGYAYDALADNIESTAQFVGGGPAFKSLGARPARNEFNAGAALTYVTPANWDMSASYDYTYKEDFAAHTGVVRATVHF